MTHMIKEGNSYVFPDYNHELLQEGNDRDMSRVLHFTLLENQLMADDFHDQLDFNRRMKDQIRALNSVTIWNFAFKTAGLEPNIDDLIELAELNEGGMNDVAVITSTGIVKGYDFIKPIIDNNRSTPLREAALIAVGGFKSESQDIQEVAYRTAAIFGTKGEKGTLGNVLEQTETVLLSGQQILGDVMRLYGEQTSSRMAHTLPKEGKRMGKKDLDV